ncbi:MAG: TMEM43 family protein [Desulfovibrio sp.]|nr:TMEM43 family protein [Desulfovibrio sp.]
MSDQYTETTYVSWGSRLGNSFKGILVGFVLIAAATYLLYWNEGRTVREGDAIAEAQMSTEDMPGVDKVDPAFNGKLVYAHGHASTKDIVSDGTFGVKTNAIALRREVEFYQWVESSRTEKQKKLGGGEDVVTTYTYDRKWTGSYIDSSNFKRSAGHENVSNVPQAVKDERFYAQKVAFGAYRLPPFLSHAMGGARPVDIKLSEAQRAELQKALFPNMPVSGNILGPTGNSASALLNAVDPMAAASQLGNNMVNAMTSNDRAPMIHVSGNTLYIGRNPSSPQIGDVRITYTEVPSADVSILAKVSGDTFEQFTASNGSRFSRLSMGTVGRDAMYQDAKDDNSMLAWVLRIVGIILVIAGFKMVVAPLGVLADVIPLLGTIVGAGAGFVATLVGIAWSFVIIALSWLRFRPMLAAGLLAVAALLVALVFLRKRNANQPVA